MWHLKYIPLYVHRVGEFCSLTGRGLVPNYSFKRPIIFSNIVDFLLLNPLQLHFGPIFDLPGALKLNYFFRRVFILLFQSPANLYYIFMKLEHPIFTIYLNIVDFVLLTPPPTPCWADFWPLGCLDVKLLLQKGIYFIAVVSCQLVLHICEVEALQLHYFLQYYSFCTFEPHSASFWAYFWPSGCLEAKLLLQKGIYVSVFVPYQLVLHICEVGSLQLHYFLQYFRFCVFWKAKDRQNCWIPKRRTTWKRRLQFFSFER